MKAVLLILLAAGLALQPAPGEHLTALSVAVPVAGTALQCYSCKSQVSNADCQHVQNCTLSETQCWTERISAIGVLTIISKGCSSHCKEDSQNYYVSKKNITCCSTDLCNANGAQAPQPAVVTLVLLSTVLSLLLWGPSQL